MLSSTPQIQFVGRLNDGLDKTYYARRIVQIPVLPSPEFPGFKWPKIRETSKTQDNIIYSRPSGLAHTIELWKTVTGKVWIPD